MACLRAIARNAEGEDDRDNRRKSFRDRRYGQLIRRAAVPMGISRSQPLKTKQRHHGEDNDENRFTPALSICTSSGVQDASRYRAILV